MQKALNRKMVDQVTFDRILSLLLRCHQMLNKYIKSIGTQGSSAVHESPPSYGGHIMSYDPLDEFPEEM